MRIIDFMKKHSPSKIEITSNEKEERVDFLFTSKGRQSGIYVSRSGEDIFDFEKMLDKMDRAFSES